jgi:general secretion pathway protein G
MRSSQSIRFQSQPNRRAARRLARRGFTLVEMIVVVTIIAILAGIIVPRLWDRVGGARASAAKSEASTIASQLKLYLIDSGVSSVPDGFDLSVLRLKPDDGGGPNGPYLEKDEDLIDPWNNPYILRVPGIVNSSFDVVSNGEDGQPGGEGNNADITQ